MNVTVMPPIPIIQIFQKENKQIPHKQVHGLIDTGCTNTCVDVTIAEELGLVPHDKKTIFTPSGRSEQFLYDVTIFFQATGDVPFNLQVCGVHLEEQPYDALIGRDFLALGILIYDGINNHWSFCH